MILHALITRGAVVTWPRNFGLDGSRLPFLSCCGCWGVGCCGAVQNLLDLSGAPTSRGCMPGPLLIDVPCAPTGGPPVGRSERSVPHRFDNFCLLPLRAQKQASAVTAATLTPWPTIASLGRHSTRLEQQHGARAPSQVPTGAGQAGVRSGVSAWLRDIPARARLRGNRRNLVE